MKNGGCFCEKRITMTCQWLKCFELISDTMILNIIPLSPKFVTCITSQWVTQTAFHSGAVARRKPGSVENRLMAPWVTRRCRRECWNLEVASSSRCTGPAEGSCRWGFGAVEISTVEMGLNKRCGETIVSVSVPPNGSIMWWLSIQRHQIFGQTLE